MLMNEQIAERIERNGDYADMRQSVPLNSIKNARELGGYHTADGRTVRSGLLLRTGNLNAVSDEDVRILSESYSLQHLIDFRMAMEMQGADDPVIDGAVYHHLDVIDPYAFAAAGMDAAAMDFNSLNLVQVVEMTERTGMLNDKMYIGFLTGEYGLRAFSRFFRILLEAAPDRAVLWHCTSGKDRTGLAAMLLLHALGVDEETAVADYLLTNEFNAGRIEGTKRTLKAQGFDDSFISKAVLVFDSVSESYLRTAIAYLKAQYGSVMGYIRDGLQLSEEDINSTREKYLV